MKTPAFDKLTAKTKLTWSGTSIHRSGIAEVTKAGAEKLKNPQETPGLINGQTAGSAYEWNVARALWALGWQFGYQVPVMGGRQVRGGQVLDFLVHTRPLYTAVIVNGEYWHSNSDEELKANELIAALVKEGIAVNNDPLIMWTPEAGTYEVAYSYLLSKIGKG